MRRIPGEFLSFFFKGGNGMMQSRTVDADTCMKTTQLFSQPLPLTDSVHTFSLLSSPGFSRSQSFPAPRSAFTENSSWWLRRAWCSLAQGQRCLHFQQSAWKKKLIPAARLNLWKTHHCDHFRHVCPFKYIFLGCFFFSNLCYLSQNKIRTKLMSALNLYAGLFRWGTPSFSAGNLSGDE